MTTENTNAGTITRVERRARWIYIWLLISAFVTVPSMLFGLRFLDVHSDFGMPAWSPDGKKIAVKSGLIVGHLYEMNSDGSSGRNIADALSFNAPAWSPDSKQIAFVDSNQTGVYVIDVDGNHKRLLAEGSRPGNPIWSPDGQRIAYVSSGTLYTINPDGSQRASLATGGSPAWSPDSKRIAFVSGPTLYLVNADGGAPTRLADGVAVNGTPSWSPDGQQIAFDGGHGLEIVDVNDPSASRSLVVGGGAPLAWSPDGQRIAYRTTDAIWILNVNKGDPQRLASGKLNGGYSLLSWLSWSPDGRQIAFDVDNYPNTDIYVVNVDGSGLNKITEPMSAFDAYAISLASSLLPAMVQLILLIGLLSPQLFVRRHAQQALGLAAMRVLSALLFIGATRGQGLWVWLPVNGALWFFGSVWGLRQIQRGECWLMRRRGEQKELPRPWAIPAQASIEKGEVIEVPAKPATEKVETKRGLRDVAYACFVVASIGILWILASGPAQYVVCPGGCPPAAWSIVSVEFFLIPGLVLAFFGLVGAILTVNVFFALRDWRLFILSALLILSVVLYFEIGFFIASDSWVIVGVMYMVEVLLLVFAILSLVFGAWWFLVGRKRAVLVTTNK